MIHDAQIRKPRRGMLTQLLIALGLCPHRNISWPQSPAKSNGERATVQCHDCHRVLRYSWQEMHIVKGNRCENTPTASTPTLPSPLQ